MGTVVDKGERKAGALGREQCLGRPHLLSGWRVRAPWAGEMGEGEAPEGWTERGIWKERGRAGGSLSSPFLVKTTVHSSARSKGERAVAQVCSWAASPAGAASAEAMHGRSPSCDQR